MSKSPIVNMFKQINWTSCTLYDLNVFWFLASILLGLFTIGFCHGLILAYGFSKFSLFPLLCIAINALGLWTVYDLFLKQSKRQ